MRFEKKMARKRKRKTQDKQPFSSDGKKLPVKPPAWTAFSEDEKAGDFPPPEGSSLLINGKHPLVKADALIMKCLLSACLVLVSAIAYKGQFEPANQIKPVISQVFTEEFQFAALQIGMNPSLAIPSHSFSRKATNHPARSR